MISRAGISVYLFGNKLDNGHIVPANGVKSEYEIAVDKHNLIVPVGCTGYVAQEIWNEVNEKLDAYYTNVDKNLKKAFAKLNEKTGKEELIDAAIAKSQGGIRKFKRNVSKKRIDRDGYIVLYEKDFTK